MTILILCSFLPFLLSPWIKVGKRWQSYTLTFPIGILLVQILAMGIRWQFAPVYTLAFSTLIIFLLTTRKVLFPRWLRVTGRISTALLLGLAFLLNWSFPDIRLPTPTGPYTVGTTLARIEDVEIRLWYPASASLNLPHYIYLGGVNRSFLGMPALLYSHLQTKTTPALMNPAVATAQSSYPVIVYGHGADSFAEDNTFRLMELASQGFVVAAIEHPIPFKDYGITAAMAQDPALFSEQLVTHVLPNRVRDVRLAIQKIEALNADDSTFQGKFRLGDLGFLGYSFGGSVVSEYCLVDERCRVIVNLDGSSFGDARNGVNAAFLQLSQSAIVPIDPIRNPQTITEKAGAYYQQEVHDLLTATHQTHAAHWRQVKGTGHAAFTDLVFWTPVRVGPLAMILGDGNPNHIAKTINALTVSFFREHLLAEPGFEQALATHHNQLETIHFESP